MVGFVSTKRAEDVASGMRYLKVTGDIPVTAEVTQMPLYYIKTFVIQTNLVHIVCAQGQ